MFYIKRNNAFFLSNERPTLDVRDSLPAGTYTIAYDNFENVYFLKSVDDMEIDFKVYGDYSHTADRILNTYNSRNTNTGVLLTGEKGSGKTLLAKLLSIKGRALGYPTILINAPWKGDSFNLFLQSIKQDVIILIDEFEKVYNGDDQNDLLTLLDGVFVDKKLFVLTCNEYSKINSYMTNRPGRIYYALEYEGLTVDFIKEYCEENLNNKEHIMPLCRLSSIFYRFNFDMLKAIVEEMNRYNENPIQVLKFLNAKPSHDGFVMYDMLLTKDGKEQEDFSPSEFRGNPLRSENICITRYFDDKERENTEEGEPHYEDLEFEQKDIVKIDPENDEFHYAFDEYTLTLKRKKPKSLNVEDTYRLLV